MRYHSTIGACKFDFPQPQPSQIFKPNFSPINHPFSFCLPSFHFIAPNSRVLLIFIISSISIRGKNLCCFIPYIVFFSSTDDDGCEKNHLFPLFPSSISLSQNLVLLNSQPRLFIYFFILATHHHSDRHSYLFFSLFISPSFVPQQIIFSYLLPLLLLLCYVLQTFLSHILKPPPIHLLWFLFLYLSIISFDEAKCGKRGKKILFDEISSTTNTKNEAYSV